MPIKILLAKSNWEVSTTPLPRFMEQCKANGFDGAEIYLAPREESSESIRMGLEKSGLFLIAQIASQGTTPQEHLASFKSQMKRAKECGAQFVNAHTGSDFFSFTENLDLFRHTLSLSADMGLPICHETHRGRALYNLPDTLRYLEAEPRLKLTGDFSHFMCVHETNLDERAALLAKVLPHCGHLHARVGFEEGPQVPHPMAPEWKEMRHRYLSIWKKVFSLAETNGATTFTITPEAGPPAYMPTVPFTNQPIADAWSVNLAVADWLRSELMSR